MNIIRIMLTLAFLCGSVALVEAKICETPAMTAIFFKKHFPGVPITFIVGPRAKRFIDAFNAYPPRSNYTGDAIVVIVRKHQRGAFLGIYEYGCAKHKGFIASALAIEMLKRSNAGRDV